MNNYWGSWFFDIELSLQETIKRELDKKGIPLEGRVEFYKDVFDKLTPKFAEIIFNTQNKYAKTNQRKQKTKRFVHG